MLSAVSTAAIRSQPDAFSHPAFVTFSMRDLVCKLWQTPRSIGSTPAREEVTLVAVDVTEAVCEMRKLAAVAQLDRAIAVHY